MTRPPYEEFVAQYRVEKSDEAFVTVVVARPAFTGLEVDDPRLLERESRDIGPAHTRGLRCTNRTGGYVIVQDSKTAECPAMPDHVLENTDP